MKKKILLAMLACFLLQVAVSAQGRAFHYDPRHRRVIFGGNAYFSAGILRKKDETVRKVIYAQRLSAGEQQILWKGERYLSDITPSPDGRIVAFIEHWWQENVPAEKANYMDRRYTNAREIVTYYYENQKLMLITAEGQFIQAIDRVRRYVWSPDGAKIAYITGNYTEDYPGFRTTGTWIMDFASDTAQKICETGYEVEWARFDGNVYIDTYDDRGVLKYDPRSSKLEPTPYKGIYFSDDGKYYYAFNREGSDFRLYSTEGGEHLIERAEAADVRNLGILVPIGWAPGVSRLLLQVGVGSGRRHFIYDVERAKIVELKEAVISWGANGREVIVLRDGRMEKVTLMGLDEQ